MSGWITQAGLFQDSDAFSSKERSPGSGPGSTGCLEPKLTGSRRTKVHCGAKTRGAATGEGGRSAPPGAVGPALGHGPAEAPPRGGPGGLQALLPRPGPAWVLPPAPKVHPPRGSLGVCCCFFFFCILFFNSKKSPVGEAGSEGDGSKARQEYRLLKSSSSQVCPTDEVSECLWCVWDGCGVCACV